MLKERIAEFIINVAKITSEQHGRVSLSNFLTDSPYV